MKTKSRQAEADPPGKKRLEMSLLDLYSACISNAEALLAEAELLLEHGHVARAYALAFTAYEEIGKSQIVADRFNRVASQNEFEEAFQKHTLKAAYVGRHISLPDGTVQYSRASVRRLYELRLRALYVDRTPDLKPLSPGDAVSTESAERMVRTVRSELDAIRHAEYLNERIGTKGLFK